MNTRVAHKKKWWGGRPPGYQLLTQGTSEVTLNVRQFKHLIQAINEKIRYIKLIFNILQKRQRSGHGISPTIISLVGRRILNPR